MDGQVDKIYQQAGAELEQAHVKLEVRVEFEVCVEAVIKVGSYEIEFFLGWICGGGGGG